LGKGLGGIISDRFGWARVTIFGLLLSALLISFGLDYPYLAIPGVLLFNMTMPVTLTAVSEMLPGRPGFSFGLTTLALIAGAFPAFTELKGALYNGWIVLVMVLASAFILYTALKLYYKSSGEHIKLVDRFLSSGNGTGA
jgi:FSR family fosmidomycin resistance protein-like MFS transporter